MLAASLVATLYYNEWHMEMMLFESAFILSVGPLFFTFCCICMVKKQNLKNKPNITCLKSSNVDAYQKLLVPLIIMAVFNLLIKIRLYQAAFGSFLGFGELLFAVRLDAWTGEHSFRFPQVVIWMTAISNYFEYVTAWILSYCIVKKDKKYNRLISLCVIHIAVTAFDGLLYGAKGSMIEPIFRFVIIFLTFCYCNKKNFRISSALLAKILSVFIVFLLGFNALTLFIGREVTKSLPEALAVYFGAEIKNFDIYMHGNDGNRPSAVWGERSFTNLYTEISGIDEGDIGVFQTVGPYSLGNVYTQYFAFHGDFGMAGVFVMTFLIAVISMFVYNRALRPAYKINPYMLIYSSMAYLLFMSFFSNNFICGIIRLGYIKALFYICLFIFITNRYITKRL